MNLTFGIRQTKTVCTVKMVAKVYFNFILKAISMVNTKNGKVATPQYTIYYTACVNHETGVQKEVYLKSNLQLHTTIVSKS